MLTPRGRETRCHANSSCARSMRASRDLPSITVIRIFDPLAGDLSREMKRQDEAMQIGAISPDNPGIECRDDRLALRRYPTLPPIARDLRAQAQVLNHDLLIALVA